jgi:hypothetical protein
MPDEVNNPGASSGALMYEKTSHERSELRGIQPGRPDLVNSSFRVTLTLPTWLTMLKWSDMHADVAKQQPIIGGLTTDRALVSARGKSDEDAFMY